MYTDNLIQFIMVKMKVKKKKKKKEKNSRNKKRLAFAAFARSELDEIKVVGGFFIVLNFFQNYDDWSVFFIFTGIIVAICLFVLFASFMNWIDFLRRIIK